MSDARGLAALLLERFKWFEAGLLALLAADGFPELRASHSALFAQLDLERGTRVAELARRMGVARQSAHQVVHELVALGLVELVTDPTNASAKLVRPTRRGRRSVAAARRAFATLEAELERRIGRAAVDELAALLRADWGAPPR
jgi:DNA-binding MarR family transcriptional regulator